jgi:hypothetical protein
MVDEPSWTARVASARASFELSVGGDLDRALKDARIAESRAKDDADAAALLIEVLLARSELELASIQKLQARAHFPDDDRFLK